MHVSSFSPFGHSFLSFPFLSPFPPSPHLLLHFSSFPSSSFPLSPPPPSLPYHIPSHLLFSFPAGPGVMETRGMTREEGGGRDREGRRMGKIDCFKVKHRGRERQGWGVHNTTKCCQSYLLKGNGCGPGSLDGMVSPQGGSVRAGVRLCGVGRVMVLERCWLSFRVRSRS